MTGRERMPKQRGTELAPVASAGAGPPPVQVLDPRRWLALAVLAVVQFILVLDATVVNVALPSIQRALHFSPSGLAWVVNGYTLMAGGFLVFGGRVADLVGRRRLFMFGLALFAIASTVSGLAQNSGMLVASRFAQGLGEAIAGPAALSLAVLMFDDPRERATAVGIWGGLAGLGGTFGVILSGVLTSYASWRWVFLINVPIAIAVLVVAPRLVKESRSNRRERVDVVGALLVTGGLILIVYGLLQAATHTWGSDRVDVPLGVGGVLLVAFVISQALLSSPLVPLRFFRNRTRVIANLATVLLTTSFISTLYILTLYLQEIGHYSPIKTGLAYLPFGVALLVAVAMSTKLEARLGVKPVLFVGFLFMSGGLALLSQIGVHADYTAHILPGLLVLAFGNGLAFPPLSNAALHAVGPTDAGLASGVQNTFLQLGGSLGLAVVVTLALRQAASRAGHGVSAAVATTDGYQLALRVTVFLGLAAALLVAMAMERVTLVAPDQQAVAEGDLADHLATAS
jgi:EmrB/QacA subfamily drug resistance transporter